MRFSGYVDIDSEHCPISFLPLREMRNFATIYGFMKKNIISVLLGAFLFFLPLATASAVNWEEFDTVAGIGMTVRVDGLEHLERTQVTFLFACKGGTIQRIADVDGGDAEVVMKDEEVQKAGVCNVRVFNDDGEEVAGGAFEIFPDVPVRFELDQVSGDDLTLDEESEFRAGYFDKFGNPTSERLVLLSADGDVRKEEEDQLGYLHFFFTPDNAGVVTLKLVDTLTDATKEFDFDVIDPTPPPVAQAPSSVNRSDSVTTLLGELIRASLLDEYTSNPDGNADAGERDYGLVDSFDVEVGDDGTTLRVNEQTDLSITVLDRRGRTVQNYVDRVTIETSDPDAIIPSGSVRFKATDRGHKVLPLALMFQTPGEQTITVRDEADPEEIFGITKIWVLGSSSAPSNREIVILEKPGATAGRKIVISGTAPAYTNLDLYSVDGAEAETKLATTASDENGAFTFEVTLGSEHSDYTLFVRDPEERVKDSEHITVHIDATAPVLQNVLLTPGTLSTGGFFTVSAEAEAGESVTANLPGTDRIVLTRKRPAETQGFDLYEGTLTAPASAGQHAVAVIARDQAGNETTQNAMLTVESAVQGFPVVQGLKAELQDQDVLLSWIKVPDAASYRVYFGSAAANLERFVDSGNSMSVRLTGLPAGETFFAVTAISHSGEESVEKSAVVSVLIKGSLFELNVSGRVNGAHLAWIAPPGIDIAHYVVRYGVESSRPTEERLVSANLTELDLFDLINGVTYYVSLSAMLKNGQLMNDRVEITVTAGQNGMPGISLSIADPLPGGIGGPGRSDAPVSSGSHGAAEYPVMPASGPSMWIFFVMALLCIGIFPSVRFFRGWKLERELALLLSDSR